MLGYCKVCGKLVSVVPRPVRPDGFRPYRPIAHEDGTALCRGSKVDV